MKTTLHVLGFLYDITGTYNLSFYIAGTFIMMAGVINLPLRQLKKCLGQNIEKTQSNSQSDIESSVS